MMGELSNNTKDLFLNQPPLDELCGVFQEYFTRDETLHFEDLCKLLSKFFERASESMYDGIKFKHELDIMFDQMDETFRWSYVVIPKNAMIRFEAFSEVVDKEFLGSLKMTNVRDYFISRIQGIKNVITEFNYFAECQVTYPERLPKSLLDDLSRNIRHKMGDLDDMYPAWLLVDAFKQEGCFMLSDSERLLFEDYSMHTGWSAMFQYLQVKDLDMKFLLNEYEVLGTEDQNGHEFKPRLKEDIKQMEASIRNWNNIIAPSEKIQSKNFSMTGR